MSKNWGAEVLGWRIGKSFWRNDFSLESLNWLSSVSNDWLMVAFGHNQTIGTYPGPCPKRFQKSLLRKLVHSPYVV